MKTLLFFTALFTMGLELPHAGCKSVSRMTDSHGTVFVVEIETNDPNLTEIVDRAIKITESKIQAIGLDGEVTRQSESDNRIEVKIYGSHDQKRLRKFLFTTYRLELKAVISPPNPSPVKTFPNKEEADANLVHGQKVLPYDGREGEFVLVEKIPVVTGEHIRNAEAVSRSGDDDDYQISFMLNPEGAVKFGDWTEKNINNYLAVVIDDRVISTAYIRSVITDQGEISGQFTKSSAEEIAISLNSGYLPATMKIIEERQFD
jgi:preprotein translocase subunit SecD